MTFLIDKSSCGGFPGPGDAEHSVTMNPMQEYVQGRDDHHSEMFGKFRRQHNKEYVNDKELHGRMHTFRQNVRSVLLKKRIVKIILSILMLGVEW